jgi:tetratricopeptide (TPR) repeat protein
MSMIVNLGLAYMLNAEYEQAQAYYAQAVSFCAQHRLVLDPGLVLNYVSVQMKLKNYLPALQLLKAHWNTLSKTETVWQRAQVMHVFCLIFLNRCAEAQQCIPKVSTKHSEFLRRYYRYAQIAIYYQVQDYEAALNEAEAFAKYLMRHAKNPSVTHDKKLINFYIRLIKMKLHLTIRKPAISSLTQKFETALTKHEVQSDIYPTIWLRQELERLNAD